LKKKIRPHLSQSTKGKMPDDEKKIVFHVLPVTFFYTFMRKNVKKKIVKYNIVWREKRETAANTASKNI